MTSRDIVRRTAIRNALQLRRTLSIAREEPANAFDIASAIGMDLWFMDLTSLEGMFTRDPHPVIVLPSLKHRPKGRVLFTCAHEVGHFQLGHAPTVDERLDEGEFPHPKSDDEIAADAFAANVLMPRSAVLRRLLCHEADPSSATPLQLYRAASELGVGYNTLLTHMRFGLELVDERWHKQRKRVTPKQLREEIVGDDRKCTLSVIDEHWPSVPIDLEVDDVVAIPIDVLVTTPANLSEFATRFSWRLLVAVRPGSGDIMVAGKKAKIRIARRGFCGQFRHRYLEDPDVE